MRQSMSCPIEYPAENEYSGIISRNIKTVCLVEQNDETHLQFEQFLSVNVVFTRLQSSPVSDDPKIQGLVDSGSRHR